MYKNKSDFLDDNFIHFYLSLCIYFVLKTDVLEAWKMSKRKACGGWMTESEHLQSW